jgi:coenzyme F420-reducing hydrogenase gamma subunit
MTKPKIGIVSFTGCAGCQLSILDLENELVDLLNLVEIIDFRMAMTGNKEGPYDVLFVEGSIVNEEQEEKLIRLSKKAKVLVAIGSCACFGGIQAIRNYCNDVKIRTTVYGKEGAKNFPVFQVKPINKVVSVDYYILECPVNKQEFLDFVKYILIGGKPKLPNMPVCHQCKAKGNRCIFLEDDIICMGPIIQEGCGALCPSHNLPCDGCRGSTLDAAYQQQVDLMVKKGASVKEITNYILKYNGEDPQVKEFLLKAWKDQDKTIEYGEDEK